MPIYKFRGDHPVLLEGQRLLAVHLLQGHADRISSSRGDYQWTVYVSPDAVSRHLFSQGQHEIEPPEAPVAFLRSHGRITREYKAPIGVGANVGAFTLHFAVLTDIRIFRWTPHLRRLKFFRTILDIRGWKRESSVYRLLFPLSEAD
mgnify:CR=1 FL=1